MARVVVQRARRAAVQIQGETTGEIGRGLAILLGIRRGDTEQDVERLADKVAVLRIFQDVEGKMNLSAADIGGAMLVVSQFTLYADVRKGRRPSFIHAAEPETGERLYDHFSAHLGSHGYRIERGRFGAEMVVSIENDGPVTIVLDSDEL